MNNYIKIIIIYKLIYRIIKNEIKKYIILYINHSIFNVKSSLELTRKRQDIN